MKIVESLIDEINNLFSNYDINEKIDFKISNVENFDYQVNNLVKYQKHKKIEEIVDNINSLLNSHEIIDNFAKGNTNIPSFKKHLLDAPDKREFIYD